MSETHPSTENLKATSLPSVCTTECQPWELQLTPTKQESVATETPVAITFNGIAYAVMMATPDNLHDFALGFCISESILEDPDQLLSCEAVSSDAGLELRLEITGKPFAKLKARRRNLTGRTGCGLCGVEALNQAIPDLKPVTDQSRITHQALQVGLKNLSKLQSVNQQTGAMHAAAWCDSNGSIKLIREDIGRHNALDKMIGARISADQDDTGFALITNRASYEMIMKAARANIGIMAAISAPTSLAIELARKCGVGLAAFTRHNRHTIYTHYERFLEASKNSYTASE